MSSVIVFVKYIGCWDENNVYICKESIVILVPMSMSYVGLLKILFEALELNLEMYTLWIKTVMTYGHNLCDHRSQ